MNSVQLQGRLCADLRATNKGYLATLAVPVRYPREETYFIPVFFPDKMGDVISKYLHKGDGIIITGSLRSYKKDDKTQISVMASDFDFPIAKKREGLAPDNSSDAPPFD